MYGGHGELRLLTMRQDTQMPCLYEIQEVSLNLLSELPQTVAIVVLVLEESAVLTIWA